jgi:chromosome segregation ATPase
LNKKKKQAENKFHQQQNDNNKHHHHQKEEEVEEDLEYQLDQCRRQLKDAEYELTRLAHRLESLKSQKRNSLAVFGNKIPHLQQLIQENLHRFTAPPIGPLGMYVKLPEKNQHFALAIEVALKGTLQSYLVVNGKDKALLDDLKKRIQCPPNQATIIIAKRSLKRYENLRCIEEKEIAKNHAICFLLDIQNDQVFNALIDVCSMETKLLFQDRMSAEKKILSSFTSNGTGNRLFRMAKFVSEVFVPNGDKFVVRNGNLAYIANKFQKRSNIICQNLEQEIKEITKKYDFVFNQVQTLQYNEKTLKQNIITYQQQKQKQIQILEQITRCFHQCQIELTRLQEELNLVEEEEEEQDPFHSKTKKKTKHFRLDTSVLEEEIQDLKKEQEEVILRQKEINHLMETNCTPNLDHLVQKLQHFHTKEENFIQETQMLEKDSQTIYETLRELKIQDVRFQKQKEKIHTTIEMYNVEITEIDKEISEITKKAQQICGFHEKIFTQETSEFLGKKLTQLTQQIQMEKKKFAGMNIQDLFVEKEEKILKFQQKQAQFDKFQKNLLKIRSMLDERQKIWQILRKEISTRTGIEFNKYMMLNNFAGRLRFKHDEQRLNLAVLRNEIGRTSASKVTDMKELSGGERSYTQVSLLLALGESIECPFRVMDEFDVFMDAVNRDMTIQLLVDAAKKESKKQFIFITPNDLSTLRKDPMVKIQKMNPPRDRLNAEHAS